MYTAVSDTLCVFVSNGAVSRDLWLSVIFKEITVAYFYVSWGVGRPMKYLSEYQVAMTVFEPATSQMLIEDGNIRT